MILTVTPNLCMDKTYKIPGFSIDAVNRPSLVHTMAGGKGINTARAYRTLGGNAVVTGFEGGLTGATLLNALRKEGIEAHCVKVPGETRTCIAVINPDDGTQTEINENGPQIGTNNAQELLDQFKRLVSEYTFTTVALCGSLPPGSPVNLYAEMKEFAQLHNVRCALDTSGEPLRDGALSSPWLLKPNRKEAEYLLERELQTDDDVVCAARTLRSRYGCAYAMVSVGSRGAVLSCDRGDWIAIPPAIQFASAVASGDTMLAGFLWSLQHGDGETRPESALRMAVGAGAANAMVVGAAICTKGSMLELADRVTLRQLR